jgi:hypothetical protein
MRNFCRRYSLVAVVGVAACLSTLVGCAPINDPYGAPYGGGYAPPPPPPAPYYGGGYYGNPGYYGNGPYDSRERRQLERERQRLEEERIRLERERQRDRYPTSPPPPPVARPTQDRCPAGFRPSENKCSNEERKRGCRDMRLPSGLGCVSR